MNLVTSARKLVCALCCAVLATGTARATTYDFSSGAGVDRFAYKRSISAVAIPPQDNAIPASPFFGSEYAAIASSDDGHYSTGVIENGSVAAVRFVFSINEPGSTITSLSVAWEGAANEDKPQIVWLWNAATGSYIQIGSQTDVRLPPGGAGDATVSATISNNAPDFVDANNRVTILVNYAEIGGALFTDYVSLTVVGAACNVNAECDDGVFCNGAELCVGGSCTVAAPIDCDDADACTTDSCNEQADVCDHLPVVCDDGLFCNGLETCNPLFGCRAGAPVDCDDADVCTADSCNEATDTCTHAPTDAPPAPAAPDPVDGAIEVVAAPVLGWDGGLPGGPACPRVFDVYLDTSNPPLTLVAVDLPSPGFSAGPLASATTYYWQVVSRDCCTETAGPVWSFTTAGTPLLSASPASIDFTIAPNQTDVVQLTLVNNGDAPTAWTAVEAKAPGGAAAAASSKPDRNPGPLVRPQIDWAIAHEPDILLVGFRSAPAGNGQLAAPARGGRRGVIGGLSDAERAAVHAEIGSTWLYSYETIPVDVVQVPTGADLQAVAAQYTARPEIAYVEPSYAVEANALPNDPSLPNLWGMHNTGQTGGTFDADIDAPEAWNIATGNQSVVVAVIDTGVDYTHPELAANMWTNNAELNGTPGVDDDANGIVDDVYGARWTGGGGLPSSGDPRDGHGHGTHVSGTIGALGNNAVGVVGVNWNVRIMGLKFLSDAGRGWTADAVSAVEYAVAHGAHLSSNSWGGGGYSQALKDAIDAAGAAGQLFVAAAGNSGQNADLFPMYPAAYSSPTIISVAATDHNDLRATFSNYGLTSVDLGAPGVNIMSTFPGNNYMTWSGTSMACPHVSGVAALVLSQNAALTPLDVKQIIMDGVDPVASLAGITVTGGRLNAANAVVLADPAPWLDLTPTSGVLGPGQSVVISVTANATGLAAGFVDSAIIRVSSGDPNSPLDVPLNLSVLCTLDPDCDDGVYCNGVETCGAGGMCQPGTPVDCNDGIACTIDSCNEATDSCDNAPTPPLLAAAAPDPADGAIEVVLSLTLGWDGGPPADPACPRVYDVYLDAGNPPATLVATDLATPAFSVGPLADAATYYWQVVSRDCCTETAGPVWSFTTAGTPLLSASPANVDFVLLPDQAGTAQVTLSNTGDAPTTWSAIETTVAAAGRAAGSRSSESNPTAVAKPDRFSVSAINWSIPHEPGTLLVGFEPLVGAGKSASRSGRTRMRSAAQRPLSMAERAGVHAACGTTKLYSCKTIPVDVVRVAARADLRAIAAEYAARPEVAFVEPNYMYEVNALPNDPNFASLWGLDNSGQTGGTLDADIDAPEAWSITTGSGNVIVGVIDTGVDYTHPELAANMWTNAAELNGVAGVDDDGNGIIDDIYGARWTGGNGLPTSGDPYDDHFHGTHVAGTIGAAGNNGLGVVGVNWNVRIMALKFLNSAGSGWTADAVAAVEYAVAKGAHLTSNSWGGGGYSQALKNAIDAAGAAGQLFIAAAGNSGQNSDIYPMYPAAYNSPTIISVAATDHNDARAWFSNYGATSVDLGAPGVSILSTSPGNTYRTLDGTSMATPHVSGVAALVLGHRPGLAALDLKQIIMDSVDPIPSMAGITVTGGRLNAASALALTDPAPWLNPAPVTGVLWPGESVVIDITADATGLAAGFVDAVLLRITSGDPNGPIDIPVSLSVGACTNDADCDDGLFCNGMETCGVTGLCQSGTAIDCNDGITCTLDACNETTASCDHLADNAACDNGLFCDGMEICDALLDCRPGTPIDCADGVGCTIDSCNEATASCDHLPSDAACDNGLFCDGAEVCDAVLDCGVGVPVDCNDGITCTIDSCNEATGGCDNVPSDAICDNGFFCDGAETCDPVLDCLPGSDPCPGQFCDETAGSCVGCVSDADCDDGVFCNGAELCDVLGVCQPGTPPICDDGIGCTVDACNTATDSCDNVPSDTLCDNGLFCDGAEICDPWADCQMGTPPDCSGLTDQCNDGVCDDVAGACVQAPVADGTACDNGDGCAGDVCQAGVCVPFNCGPPPPAAPTGLKSGIEKDVQLEWKPNREPDLAGYNVYRSQASGGPYSLVATLVPKEAYVEVPAPGYYCYVVTAVNTSGAESDYSNEVCGVVVAGG